MMAEASAIRIQARDVKIKGPENKDIIADLKSEVQDEQHISEYYASETNKPDKEEIELESKEEI